MSPKERRKRLCEYLEIMDGWVTIKELANNLGISERTVHSDIEQLNESLQEVESTIEKKRGVGVRLVNHVKASKTEQIVNVEEIMDRKILILAKLLVQSKVVTYVDLAEEYFISPTSIKNDFDEIRSLLNEHTTVQLVSDLNGTRIVGNESSVREALIWFNQDVLATTSSIQRSNVEKLKEIFQQFYGDNLVNVSYDILLNFVINNYSLLSDYYIFNTLNVYIVQLHRIKMGYQMDSCQQDIRDIDFANLEEYTSGASQLLSRASSRLSFEYRDTEVSFLSKYLILNRIEQLPSEASNQRFIEQLIFHLSEALGVDFTSDEKLLKQLKQHVPPMIYRLKLRINVDNPFVGQIKNEYRQTFHTIMLAISKFETECNRQVVLNTFC